MKVNTLKFSDPYFPELLAQIPSAPKQIFWLGRHPNNLMSKPRVAIVGSRKPTPYGCHITEKLTLELAEAGVVIISGLAYGIDVIAHKTALAAGGITVAVLPSSLDKIYPSTHINTARQILNKGTLISEYPLGDAIAYKSNFIARNRLVSGLADTLLITEAAINSGSLHTARFALEQGRTVMAVPGNITSPASQGCNNLIKSGAVPVTSSEDIFFALNISPQTAKAEKEFLGSLEEQLVYNILKKGISDQEEIAQTSRLDSSVVSGALTILEISGYVRAAGNGSWIIN
jgi:DNA processing protein